MITQLKRLSTLLAIGLALCIYTPLAFSSHESTGRQWLKSEYPYTGDDMQESSFLSFTNDGYTAALVLVRLDTKSKRDCEIGQEKGLDGRCWPYMDLLSLCTDNDGTHLPPRYKKLENSNRKYQPIELVCVPSKADKHVFSGCSSLNAAIDIGRISFNQVKPFMQRTCFGVPE